MDLNQAHQLFMEKIRTNPHTKGAFEQFEFKAMDKVYVYKHVMHLNSCLAIVSNLLAVFIVLKHSPPQIGIYKRYLLNIMFWSVCLDIYLSSFYVPFFPIPVVTLCSFGFLEQFNSHYSQLLFLFILFSLISCLGVSVIIAFLYRYLVLTERVYYLHNLKSMFCVGLLHICYGMPVSLTAIYYIASSYDGIILDMLTKLQSLYYFAQTRSCLFMTDAGSKIVANALLYLIIGAIIFSEICCITLVYKTLAYIKRYQSNIINQSFKKHRELTISLVFQIAIPFFLSAIPFTAIIVIVIYEPNDRGFAQSAGILLFEIASLHSTMNAISMLLLIKPYRQAIHKMLCSCVRPKFRSYRIEQTREIS